MLRTSRGITIPQFFSLQIILYLTTCLAEIPCGFITDKIRYKNTIVLAMGLMTLARIQFIFADSFYIFVIEAILGGIAISFMSGTMNAYIYQLLGEEDFEKTFLVLIIMELLDLFQALFYFHSFIKSEA